MLGGPPVQKLSTPGFASLAANRKSLSSLTESNGRKETTPQVVGQLEEALGAVETRLQPGYTVPASQDRLEIFTFAI